MSHLAYLFLGSVLRVPALIFPVFHQLKSTLLLMNRPTHGIEHWALLFAPFSGSFYLACLPNSEVTFPCLLFGERNESHLFPIFCRPDSPRGRKFCCSACWDQKYWDFGLCTTKCFVLRPLCCWWLSQPFLWAQSDSGTLGALEHSSSTVIMRDLPDCP